MVALMYLEYYGLTELPFELTPNPRFLFLTPSHREALSNLEYGVEAGKGLTLLIGEAGTGKTTLIRTVLRGLTERAAFFLYVKNPALTRSEFIEFLAKGFGLSDLAAGSKARFLDEMEEALVFRRREGRQVVLIVDEAQSLSDEILEEIRLLANIENDAHKLLPLVISGQPEFAEALNRPQLRQLKQRVALRCELRPLDLNETAAYIAARLRIAGGDSARVFTREAVTLVHERSAGIPRTVSVLCDNAMVSGFASQTRPVTRDIVLGVCRDFDLGKRTRVAEAAPPIVETAAAREAPGPASTPEPAVAASHGRLFHFF
jgi:general secretion pathway protein A